MSQENTKVDEGVGDETLAIDGGVPVRREPLPPCLPGGLAIGEEEKAEVLEVIEAQSPNAAKATRSAAVPELTAKACRLPIFSANSRSKAFTLPRGFVP